MGKNRKTGEGEDDANRQENTASPHVEIEEPEVGRDLQVKNNITQSNNRSLEGFPNQQNSIYRGWIAIIDMITSLPISVRSLDITFASAIGGAFLLLYLSLSTIYNQSQTQFMMLFSEIQLPLAGHLFAISIITVIFGAMYFQVRETTDCPNCNEPVGLRIKSEVIFPGISNSTTEYGERILRCKVCEEEFTQRFSKKKFNE